MASGFSISIICLNASGLPYGVSITANDVTVDGFEIIGDDLTVSGVTIANAQNVVVSNNKIHGMALPNPGNISPASYGVLVYGGALDTNSNIVINGNEIYDINLIKFNNTDKDSNPEDIFNLYKSYKQAREYSYNSRDYFLQASDLEMEVNNSTLEAAKEMKKIMNNIDNIFIPSIKKTAQEVGVELK